MCRLFGFRSAIPSQVHSSLMSAENALGVQSEKHPDGWGVAYYLAGSPHLIKSAAAAYDDRLFKRVSGIVSSQTVIAHVRRATVGDKTLINCHPFQYGRWVMAHNGEIEQYDQVKDELVQLVDPRLRRFILGDTDSEAIFYLFLTYLSRREELHRPGADIENVSASLRQTIETIQEMTDAHKLPKPSLTLCVTDGVLMVASRYGKELHRSTYKQNCPDREICPSLTYECENPSKTGYVSHFILSSEPLQGHNIWEALDDRAIIGCDWRMHSHEWRM
ncbi:MAG TPA: class II glutamine amidotransferase [Myxococcales bacterium]|nr:class II glutamine amidotransferase [Myxococcales bacterium]